MPHSKWCFFAAVFGNVVNAETSARLGGVVDLVVTALTPYDPHVSSAAPFTMPSTLQRVLKSLAPYSRSSASVENGL